MNCEEFQDILLFSADHESSDSEVESPSGIIRDYNDSDTDSLDLEPEVTLPKVSIVTSSVTSVTNTVTSVTNLLGSFLKKNESEPDLDDFEMISEDELSAESPQFAIWIVLSKDFHPLHPNLSTNVHLE